MSSLIKVYTVALVLSVSLLMSGVAQAALSSTHYQIGADSINFVGNETSVSAHYGLRDTGGESATGESQGILYAIKAGYRQMLGLITGPIPPVTPPASAPETTSSGGGGGVLVQSAFSVQSITVGASDTALLVDVELNQPGKTVLVWGVSTLYDGGSITSNNLQQSHIFKITNLVPGTTYYFAVQAVSEIGARAGQVSQSATTLATRDTTAPANPNKLTLEQSLFGTKIAWQNPSGLDTELVKVVRSTDFYPTSPDEGVVVYEGRAEQALDTKALAGKLYYYTLFTKDVSGNYSSGAIAKIYITKAGESAPAQATDTFAVATPRPTIDPVIDRLNLFDFLVTQNEKMTLGENGKIFIDGGKQFKVAIDYNKLPEVLKTMVVTIKDLKQPDQVFTFLLRVNNAKTQYEALVDKLNRGGNFAMVISILDHANRGVKQVSGELVVSTPKPESLFSRFMNDPMGSLKRIGWLWWPLLVLVGIVVRIRLWLTARAV
ncbi:MAG: hypothetical protein RLZZ347_324 [Candidatus Parcubacteria bacterium]